MNRCNSLERKSGLYGWQTNPEGAKDTENDKAADEEVASERKALQAAKKHTKDKSRKRQ